MDGEEIEVTAFRRVWRKGGPYRTLLTVCVPNERTGSPSQIVWLIEPSWRGAKCPNYEDYVAARAAAAPRGWRPATIRANTSLSRPELRQ